MAADESVLEQLPSLLYVSHSFLVTAVTSLVTAVTLHIEIRIY